MVSAIPGRQAAMAEGAERNTGHGGLRARIESLALAPLAADARCMQAMHAVTGYLITVLRCAFVALQLREVVAWKENVSVCPRWLNTALWNVHQSQALE